MLSARAAVSSCGEPRLVLEGSQVAVHPDSRGAAPAFMCRSEPSSSERSCNRRSRSPRSMLRAVYVLQAMTHDSLSEQVRAASDLGRRCRDVAHGFPAANDGTEAGSVT